MTKGQTITGVSSCARAMRRAALLVAIAAFAAVGTAEQSPQSLARQHSPDAATPAAAGGTIGAAAFTLGDYHNWRDNVTKSSPHNNSAAQPAQPSRPARSDFADYLQLPKVFSLNDAAAAALVSRLGDDSTFADYYHNRQFFLFSALDNALSQTAQDIILNEFSAVKKAEVQLQTELGNRKGNLGINLIGAIAENQTNALGWQLRAYGGQDNNKGFNLGAFYRHRTDDSLIGANAFLDYEKTKIENRQLTFFRYSIGGEVSHKLGSFAANYYIPITESRQVNAGVFAFSRRGFDARARIALPGAAFVHAAFDYYKFEGKGEAPGEEGIRYGAEGHLLPGLRVGVFYDEEQKQLGGELSYAHTIGEQAQRAGGGNVAYYNDLYAPVWREHSQRIALLTIRLRAAGGEIIADGRLRTVTMLPDALPSGFTYSYVLLPTVASLRAAGLTISGDALLYRSPPHRGMVTATATVIATDTARETSKFTIHISIGAVPPASLVSNFGGAFVGDGMTNSVMVLTSGVGVLGYGDEFAFSVMQLREGEYSFAGNTLMFRSVPSRGTAVISATVLATVTTDDDALISLFFMVTTMPPAGIIRAFSLSVVGDGMTNQLTPVLTGGIGDLAYGDAFDFSVMQSGGEYSIVENTLMFRSVPARGMAVITATIRASVTTDPYSPLLSLFFNVTTMPPAGIMRDFAADAFSGNGGRRAPVLTLMPGVGELVVGSNYSYELLADSNFFSFAGSVVSFRSVPVRGVVTATATVLATDTTDTTVPVASVFLAITSTPTTLPGAAQRGFGAALMFVNNTETMPVLTLASGLGNLAHESTYAYSIMQDGSQFDRMGNVIRFRLDGSVAKVAVATIIAVDTTDVGAPNASLFISVTASVPSALSAMATGVSATIAAGRGADSAVFGSVQASGGEGPYTYAVVDTDNFLWDDGVRIRSGFGVSATYPASVLSRTAVVRVDDASPLTQPVSVTLSVMAFAPISISVEILTNVASTSTQRYFRWEVGGGIGPFQPAPTSVTANPDRTYVFAAAWSNGGNATNFAGIQGHAVTLFFPPTHIRFASAKFPVGEQIIVLRADDDPNFNVLNQQGMVVPPGSPGSSPDDPNDITPPALHRFTITIVAP